MGNLTLATFGLIWIAITLGSVGQIFIKLGLGKGGIPSGHTPLHTIVNILAAMIAPKVMAGLFCYVVSTFFWVLVISRVRLSVAYPMISMSYIVVVLLSQWVLHEHVDWRFAGFGLLFISAGVAFIGLGLGQSGGR